MCAYYGFPRTRRSFGRAWRSPVIVGLRLRTKSSVLCCVVVTTFSVSADLRPSAVQQHNNITSVVSEGPCEKYRRDRRPNPVEINLVYCACALTPCGTTGRRRVGTILLCTPCPFSSVSTLVRDRLCPLCADRRWSATVMWGHRRAGHRAVGGWGGESGGERKRSFSTSVRSCK